MPGRQLHPVGPHRSNRMKAGSFLSPVRWVAMLVLLLMVVAVAYAGYIAISYWPSIAV